MTYFRKNIEQMPGYVPGEQPGADGRVIKLNTNENPYPPPPRVLQVLRETDWSLLRKYPDPMANKVRDIIARLFDGDRENVLCGNGSDELLTLVLRTFVGEGERIAWPTPTYSLYPVLAEIQAAEAVEVPTRDDFTVPLGDLAQVDAKVVILCNPNAPTGVFTPVDAIADLADRFDGVVVVDEAYADFGPGSAIAAVKEKPNLLVLRTLSKSYSLAGLRFGFAVGPADLIAGLAKAKDSYNVDAVAIEVASAALEGQDWMRANAETIRAERDRIAQHLDALGFDVTPSEANFLLARAPDGQAEACYRYLKERGILVRYWNLPRLADKVRITVGTPEENDALLAALDQRCEETRA